MKDKAEITQDGVDESLDAAVFENGFTDLMSRTPMEVAIDMVTYDPEFEGTEPEALVPFVQDYQAWYAASMKKKTRSGFHAYL